MNVNKKLMAYDENIGANNVLIPYVLTTSVWTEDGRCLDEILKTSPAAVEKELKKLVAGAPEELDTLKEIAGALGENKDSIKEILNSIGSRIKQPAINGREGQVLKIVDGQIAWADDKDTIYTPSEITEAATISTDSNHRFVTDVQMEIWDSKIDEVKAKEILNAFNRDIENLFGKADGIAALDWLGKVPRQQLPRELAWKDDLSGYLSSYEASITYARKEDVKDVDLSNYVKKDEAKTKLADFTDDSTHRLVTDTEKSNWNGKQDKLVESSTIKIGTDNKVELKSLSGLNVSRTQANAYDTSNTWKTVGNSRDLEDWLGDLAKRTVELRDGKASKQDIEDRIAKLIDGAPQDLDTLKEIAEKIKSGDSASAAMLKQIAEKQGKLIASGTIKIGTNNKIEINSMSGVDVSRAKTDGHDSTPWKERTETRDLEDWIGDFDKRTRELKDKIEGNIVEVSESELSSLQQKQGVLYIVKE